MAVGSLSSSCTRCHTCTHTGRWLGSVAGCKQSPSLSSFTSLIYHFLPPHMPLSWGAQNSDKRPQGPESLSYNDNWPLTACLRGTTTPHLYVFIPLHTVSAPPLLTLFFFSFNFVSLLPTTLCESGCWLKQSPLKLAVPVSPLFGSAPKAGDFHQAAECLQSPQRMFWRTTSGLLCDGLMCEIARGSLADYRSCPTTGPEAPVSFQKKILKHVKVCCVEVLYRVVNGCGK